MHAHRDGLEHRRAVAGERALARHARGLEHRLGVVAVDLDAREAVGGRALDGVDRELLVERGRVRVLVVLQHEDHGELLDAGPVHRLVEVAARGRAVAEPRDRDALLAAQLEGHRQAGRDQHHVGQHRDHADAALRAVAEVDVAVAAAGDAGLAAHVLAEDPRGLDAADDVRGEVAVQDAQAVLGAHRPRRAGGDGLLAEPVVEAAGHLALAVQGHRALLDAAHHQHRAQQPDPVLGGQVLRYVRGYRGALSRLGRHQASLLPLRCRAGPGIAGLASAVSRDLRGARLDAARVGHRRVTLEGMDAPGQVERLWVRRLRWRMRGAWQWPAFARADGGRRGAADAAAVLRGGAGDARRGAAAGGVRRTCSRSRSSGRCSALRLRRRRPDLPRLIAADYAATAVLVLICAGLLAGGLLHRPAVAAERADVAAVAASTHDYVVAPGARLPRRAGRDGRDARRGGPLPLVRARAGPAALAVPVRDHRPAARRASPRIPTGRPTRPTGCTAASASLAGDSALRRRSRRCAGRMCDGRGVSLKPPCG